MFNCKELKIANYNNTLHNWDRNRFCNSKEQKITNHNNTLYYIIEIEIEEIDFAIENN